MAAENGLTAEEQERWKKTLVENTKKIEANPEDHVAHKRRGDANLSLRNIENAVEDYNNAIKLKPDYAAAYNSRGTISSQLGHLSVAIGDYSKAIELDPDMFEAYLNRGSTRNLLKQFEYAFYDMKRAIEIKPNDTRGYSLRGGFLAERGEFEDAIKDFDKVLSIEPQDGDTLVKRGRVKMAIAQFEGAISDFNQAIEISPNKSNAFIERGNARYELKQIEEATQDFETAISLEPNNSNAFIGLGDAKIALGDIEEAIDQYDKALQVGPNNILALNKRGLAKSQLGRYFDAITDFDKAIQIQPDEISIFHNRAIAIAEQTAEQTKQKYMQAYEKGIASIVDSQKIIPIYANEILFTYRRLFGHDSVEAKNWENVLVNIEGNESYSNVKDENKKTTNLDSKLHIDAGKASKRLQIWVLVIVAIVTWTFYSIYEDIISRLGFHHIFQYTSVIAILAAPFFFHARQIIRRAEDERTIAHALTRDMISLLFWSAQEPDDRSSNRAKLANAMLHHMGTNSTADVSLRMMGRKRSGADEGRGDEGRLSFMESTLQDIKCQLDVIKGQQNTKGD